jgi:hypothetical protein
MQLKMILRYQLTPVRMAIINHTNKSKLWRGFRGKGTLILCCVTTMEVPQKVKIDLTYATPLLGIYWKEFKPGYNSDTCIPMLIEAL